MGIRQTKNTWHFHSGAQPSRGDQAHPDHPEVTPVSPEGFSRLVPASGGGGHAVVPGRPHHGVLRHTHVSVLCPPLAGWPRVSRGGCVVGGAPRCQAQSRAGGRGEHGAPPAPGGHGGPRDWAGRLAGRQVCSQADTSGQVCPSVNCIGTCPRFSQQCQRFLS